MKKNLCISPCWKILFTAILISFSTGVLASNSQGIPKVLEQLELVTMKLSQIESQLTSQQQQLTELQQETIPCTPDRYRSGVCGEGNLPFDLVVSICGSLSGEATIEGKYAVDSRTSVQGGVGWKEVLDVDITVEAGMPGAVVIPGTPIPVIFPSEIAASAGGSVGLGMDGCIEGIKIPIGKNIDRDRVLALIAKLENGAQQIQASLLDALDNAYNTEAIANALAAKDVLASVEFNGDDPLSVFTSNEVLQLANLLPAGERMNRLVTNPGDMIPNIDPFNFRLCDSFQNSPVLNEKMNNVCSFVSNDLPQFGVVSGAFEKIDDLNKLMLDLPETIEFIISDIMPDVSTLPSPLPPTSRFCQRFPRLCR